MPASFLPSIYPPAPGQINTYQPAIAQATNAAGQVDYPMLQRILGLSSTQMDQMVQSGALDRNYTGMIDPMTVAGQGWQSEVDKWNAATGTPIWDQFHGSNSARAGSGSGSGSDAGGSGAAAPTSVGATSGLLGSSATSQSGGPSGISGFPNISGGTGLANYLPGQSPQPTNMGIPNYLPGQTSGQPVGQGNVQMTQPGAQQGLQQYYNTPGYQLTNSPMAANQFQTSPGYQFAVDQALGQVQRNAASRGLLDSGAGLRAMTDRAQGMASQEFNNWQQNQQNQFNQYQNRLAGLASGPTGAEMAYGLGQGMGANAMQTGSNIGSLLANQGNSLFGGIVGAGGAQAQNVSQAGNMQAQILAGNLQTQLALAALGGQRR